MYAATQYYAYVNGSSSDDVGSKGRLESPFIDASTKVCVEFFYHMFGSGEGSLTLNVKVGELTKSGLFCNSLRRLKCGGP